MDKYKVLNLGMYKTKGQITDELVEKHYNLLKKQCLQFYKDDPIKEEHLKILEDAYIALRTEADREKYDLHEKKNEIEFKKRIKVNTQPINTSAILQKILKEAKDKYPIQKQGEERENE